MMVPWTISAHDPAQLGAHHQETVSTAGSIEAKEPGLPMVCLICVSPWPSRAIVIVMRPNRVHQGALAGGAWIWLRASKRSAGCAPNGSGDELSAQKATVAARPRLASAPLRLPPAQRPGPSLWRTSGEHAPDVRAGRALCELPSTSPMAPSADAGGSLAMLLIHSMMLFQQRPATPPIALAVPFTLSAARGAQSSRANVARARRSPKPPPPANYGPSSLRCAQLNDKSAD